MVRAYRPDELTAMFAVATPEEWILFQFFLCTGVREQEATHPEYDDLDFCDGVYTVRDKDDWTIKDREEREVPLPTFLVEALKQRMLRSAGKLIFPTSTGKTDGQDGLDARTLQKRLGHSSLETILAYLEGEEARSNRSKEQVNGTFVVFANGGKEARA